MSYKVTIEVIQGAKKGEKHEYGGFERIYIGRQDDCGIVLPDNTVSRYHCIIEITPSEVQLQDFGSLNGTYLNGEMIGQRERNQSWEEAKEDEHKVYPLHNGDELGLGRQCKLRCMIEAGETCAECWAELPKSVSENETVFEEEGTVPIYYNKDGKRICKECLSDREKILDEILNQMINLPGFKNPTDQSPIEGYRKISLLGRGGMGEVWKVQETKTGKYYALKTMLPEVKADDKAVKMFIRESSMGEQLKHKNIVQVYKTGYSNGTFYILMDLCNGGSADKLIKKKGGKLTLELSTWIILQILSGLDYAHKTEINAVVPSGLSGEETVCVRGIVHRDFKPGNIFLSDTSEHPIAMIADFGFSKAFETAGLSGISKTGLPSGTPPYMPRQQAMNYKYAKPEVDVWAAAASYYYMLTGKDPKNFRFGKNVWQIVVTESAVPILDRNPSIPAPIARVVDKALQEIPQIGYTTAGEFRKDLVAALPKDLRIAVGEVI